MCASNELHNELVTFKTTPNRLLGATALAMSQAASTIFKEAGHVVWQCERIAGTRCMGGRIELEQSDRSSEGTRGQCHCGSVAAHLLSDDVAALERIPVVLAGHAYAGARLPTL